MDAFGKKDFLTLPRNQAGGDAETFPSMDKENFLDFNTIKEMLSSIKREVDRSLSKLEAGHIQVGPETNALKVKPKLQDIRLHGGGHKEAGPCDLGREIGFSFNKLNGLEGNRIGWKVFINIGLNKENS
ncbi:hypothetical protein SLA2020_263040 [Shorea laevis]